MKKLTLILIFTLTASAQNNRSRSRNVPPTAPAPPRAVSGLSYLQKIAYMQQQGILHRTISFQPSDLAGTVGSDDGFFINDGQANPVPAVLDSTTKASGQNSIKFTIPSASSAGSSGQWFMNFSADRLTQYGANQTFFVQYMEKFDRYFFEHNFAGGGGWKQDIIGTGDSTECTPSNTATCAISHSDLEVVLQNTNQRGFPQMYNDVNGNSIPWEEPYGSSDFKLENALPCLYQSMPSGPGCSHYSLGLLNKTDQITQWATITQQFTLGPLVSNTFRGSNIKVWISWGGKAAIKLFDWTTDLSAPGGQKFGKLWLLPYHTNKNPAEVHNPTYVWYANPIIGVGAVPAGLLTTMEPVGAIGQIAAAMPARSWAEVPQDPTAAATICVGQISANILGYSTNMAYDGSENAYFMGADHGAPNLLLVRYKKVANSWELLNGSTSITGHGYNHISVNTFTGDIYFKDYGTFGVSTEPVWILKPGVWAADHLYDLPSQYWQNSSATAFWSGSVSGGGNAGTHVVFNGGAANVNFYDPLKRKVFASVNISGGKLLDAYNSVMSYSNKLNIAELGLGDGNGANATTNWRINSNTTVTAMPAAPIRFGIQMANLATEPTTGGFTIIGENKIYYLNPTGSGSWTLLNTAGDAWPSDFGEPSKTIAGSSGVRAMVSFTVPEDDVIVYVQATSSVVRMFLYKYAISAGS